MLWGLFRTKSPPDGQRGHRLINLRLPLHVTILSIFFLWTMVHAVTAAADVSQHDLQTKMEYCTTCHGVAGRGFRGFYPIPRLAGQQIKYIEKQMHAFIERRRTNNIMFNVARVLSPEMITALAKTFHDLNPEPLSDGPKDLAAAGKKIFEEGIPEANVTPCTTCHGPDAKGNEESPRLAGQLSDYIVDKVKNWSNEGGQDPGNAAPSAIMEPIAHGLSDAQIKAVAAYVSALP